MNLRDKISRWMFNRYGIDKLSYALIITYGVIAILNMFVRSTIINYGSVLIIVYLLFRMTSKNITKRRIENSLFEKYFNPIKAFFQLEKRRIREIKTYRFRKCPNCKLVLRLKKKTGIHKVDCPRCHRELSVRIWL